MPLNANALGQQQFGDWLHNDPGILRKLFLGLTQLPHDVYQNPQTDIGPAQALPYAAQFAVPGTTMVPKGALGMAGSRLGAEAMGAAQQPMRVYHGTFAGPSSHVEGGTGVDWPHSGQFGLPKRNMEKGVFVTPDPVLAQHFGDTIMPLDYTPQNAMTVDVTKFPGADRSLKGNATSIPYRTGLVQAIIQAARNAGKDAVILKNMHEFGGTAPDQIILLNSRGNLKSATTGDTLFTGGSPLGAAAMGRQQQISPDQAQKYFRGNLL